MLVRVFQLPDNRVRIMRPNQKFRLPGESDAAFIARIGSISVLRDPTLRDLPFSDIDNAVIPPLKRIDAQGDELPIHDAWRWNGVTVILDEMAIPPNWEKFMERLHKVLLATKRVNIALEISNFREAVTLRDIQLFQAAYDKIKLAGLLPSELDAVKLTIAEKKIPINL